MNDPRDTPFASASVLGLSFRRNDQGQNHCGILCGLDEAAPVHVHLAWHMRLRSEGPTDDDFWAEVADLVNAEKLVIAVHTDRIGKNGPDVPYGFAAGQISFADDGSIVGSRVGRGFTCATFVTEVFGHLGFELVEEQGWPENANDEWQRWVVETLRETGAHELHVLAVAKQVGARRIRPEEVVGAGRADDRPVNFDGAQLLAAEVIAEVEALKAARQAAQPG